MELAKPKTKKKTKTKSPRHVDEQAPVSDIDDVDIDFPSTSSTAIDAPPNQEGSASTPLMQALCLEDAIDDEVVVTDPPLETNTEQDDGDITINNTKPPAEELCATDISSAAPLSSAPPEDVEQPSAPQLGLRHQPVSSLRYPDLQHIQRELHVLPDVPRLTESVAAVTATIASTEATVTPFTREQMSDLYANPELELADQFEQHFVHTELDADYKPHVLHELLTKYARCRQTLRINRMDVDAVQKRIGQLEPLLWKREKRTERYQATCADSVVVRGSEQYEFASVDESVFDKVSTQLTELLNLVSFNCALNLYLSETHKLQITQLVQQLQRLTVNQAALVHLRNAISIFFSFLRRSLPDQVFGDDLKAWLRHLVAHLLHTAATWPDHLFLTFHVMRCPAGVSDWAAAFVQLPRPPIDSKALGRFDSMELHRCVAYLRALLRPVAGRTEFLQKHVRPRLTSETPMDPVQEDLWILVDSDGDDAGGSDETTGNDRTTGPGAVLKEKDLIALLNQLPLEQMFSSITMASPDNGSFTIETEALNATHVLKLIAFANELVQLLGDGLRTYKTERFRQFAKMLGRLIRHTVVYVAETYALFKRGHTFDGLSSATQVRIGVEFDVFVLRAADFIYRSRCLGAWQYLAVLPFVELRAETVWRLYVFLVSGGPAGTIDADEIEDSKSKALSADFLQRYFNDTVIDVPAEDMYYLLQTFASIAQSRDATGPDRTLIECVMLHLFEIGFINAATTATSYKIVRDLLVNITDESPALMSALLQHTKLRFADIDTTNTSAVYLFKALPLTSWHPTEADFQIIAGWLLHAGYETAENGLARTIFSRLNWNFAVEANDGVAERLHLSVDLHVRMACLLCEVAARHAPETVGRSGITESVRQVSNMVKGGATAQQRFTSWCWNMVTVLRLHSMDHGREARAHLLMQPAQAMARVPELERLAAVFDGVTARCPLALYVSVLATQWGHSVPLVCHRGFAQMSRLLDDYRQSAVVRCLELVTPLFIECPESLSKCEPFQSILTLLLNADKTYMKMAKDLITADYPGPVVEMLGQMIQSQCIQHHHYAFASPLPLCMLWLECLTAPSAWQRDTNAVYLVDVVLRVAWQSAAMWSHAKEFFRFMCTSKGDVERVVTRSTSFLAPFLGGGSANGATLPVLPAVSPSTLWMSLITLELEHEILELQSGVWPELLRQLRASSARVTLDSVIKTAATAVHCTQAPSATTLVLYKYCNLIVACAADHRLLPVVCQRFFQLYLGRVPMADDEKRFAGAFGVADKFYEHNVGLMKRLKKHFAHVEAELKTVSLKSEDESMVAFHASCSRIVGTFGLWLEETRLNQLDGGSQQYAQFPPQYEMHRLARIFGGDDSYWNDFVHLPSIREQQRTEAHKWQQSCFRANTIAPRKAPAPTTIRREPQENIGRQLKTYDAPLPVPALAAETAIIPEVQDMDRLLGLLQSDFARLNATARDFHTAVQELNFTDCNYKDLVRVLWSNRSMRCSRTLHCSSMLSSSSCRGGRDVTITISEPTIDGRIQNKIERNREKHQLNIDRQMTAPTADTVLVFVRIQHYVRDILARYAHLQQLQQSGTNAAQHKDMCDIAAVGIAFFYEIVNGMSEFADAFPPAHELLGEVLGQLGQLIRDNQSGEGVRLLQTALRRPHLVQLLSDMFTPSATAPVYFLEMYQFLVDSHIQKCDTKILFVLLSKFDVAKWLVTFMPKLVDISQLLKIIVKGLESWNQSDAALIQGVLRRHLVHIFQYDFPEHYGEVLQTVLAGCSDQRLLPTVLAELLQSIYQMANCPLPIESLQTQQPTTPTSLERVAVAVDGQSLQRQQQLNECVANFAATQQLFNFKAVQDTLALVAQHYRNERLQHGLHGLYPKHRELCVVVAVLLHSYADALLVTAVHAYPGLLADKLLEWLWPSLCDCFAPWLMPYYPHAMQSPSGNQQTQQQPANWIRQVLANNDVLLPWSELYSGREAQHMLHTFVDCVLYILDTLPGSDQLLGHLFQWYESHYAHVCVSRHVRLPVHVALHRLPWERFQPQPLHIDCIHRTLQQFLPEAHTFVGHVFVRVDWCGWLRDQLPMWDTVTGLRHRMLGSLLHVYVQLSFEPNVRETEGGAPLLRMLQEAGAFPWAQLPYASVGPVFDALVLIAEPSIVLTTLNSERQHEAVDAAVLNILELASAMRPVNAAPGSGERLSPSQTQAKRILYVKTIVRLLRLCGTKHQQLLATTDGLSAFRAAVRRLLDLIDSLTSADVALGPQETVDLMIEVVGSLQLPGEFTSKMFVEALIQWQVECDHASALIPATLTAIGSCKTFTNNVIALLESSMYQYFRLPADAGDCKVAQQQTTTGTWQHVAELLGASLPSIEGTDLVQRHHLLTLHVFTVYKLRSLQNVGEQLTLLQKLHLILENYKTSEATEPKLLVLWSLMITFGVQRLRLSDNAKSLLLTLGRFLQGVSAHADGWGDGVLGAFGLRRDAISRRRRLATRCLACVVFSLFPDTSDPRMPCKEYTLAIDELAAHIQSKRYADVRSVGLLAIELVQTQRTATAAIASGAAFEAQTTQNVCALLRLFYKEAGFLATLEQLWVFHK